MLAALLWVAVGLPLFLTADHSYNISDPSQAWLLLANVSLWIVTAAVCHGLRRAVIGGELANRQLQEKREKLSNILESITDGFFAVTSDWTVTRANRHFLTQFGLDGQLVGRNLWDATPLGSNIAMRNTLDGAMRARTFQSFELKSDADNRWFHVRCHPAEERGMFCIVQEISERKGVEEHQDRMLAYERAARSSAEQASNLKDQFLATLSHELRTPLTSLFGWLDLIEARSELDPLALEGIHAVRRSATSLNQLIDELLDVSRINAGKVRLELLPMDLGEAVEDAIDVIRPAGMAKSIEISFAMPADKAYILGDRERIHQVLANVLGNAVRFTPQGGRVDVSIMLGEAGWSIAVQDTGEGIDQIALRTIFERFRQADPGSTRRHGGLGLGLAIARQLVELHGGEIVAHSDGLDKGSTFTITFPATGVPHSIGRLSTPGLPQTRSRSLAGVKIVLVEDDQSTREVLARLLVAEGAIIEAYTSGKDALRALHIECPDLLISDIGMPDMDGYQMISFIRAIGGPCQTVPAIALTAFARTEDREEALAQGFSAHLSKPVALPELLNVISALLPEAPEAGEDPSEDHCSEGRAKSGSTGASTP